jgi:hypothetical protein
LLAVAREFINPDVSRSGLDRCLRRHGVGNFKALLPPTSPGAHGTFAAYEPGFVYIDVKSLPRMADESKRRYLFVAIDRATRWVFVQVKPSKSARGARVCGGAHQSLSLPRPDSSHRQRQRVHRPLRH